MYYSLKSFALTGLNAVSLDIEIDAGNGMPIFIIVGMPDTAIKESKERIILALKNSGFDFPPRKIIVNFSPADIRKEGAAYDLPVAVGILAATGQINAPDLSDTIIIGELSLDGRVKHTKGILPITIAAKKQGIKKIIVPCDNFHEANLVEGIDVVCVRNVLDLLEHLVSGKRIESGAAKLPKIVTYETDFAEIKGQYFARRAMEVAAAGSHNILMVGPPGSGKTMIARRLPTILPDMTFEESLETTKIYSISGKLGRVSSLIKTRPFRAPHHTISDIALIGGGSYPKPGEISLANNGVLFLDEFAEYKKNAIEALRQPLEDGDVTISRAKDSVNFPARFILVASMNPCPCGYLGDETRECTCSPFMVKKYFSKISGPVLDRIDIQVEVKSLKYNEMTMKEQGEKSEKVRDRTMAAYEIQKKRFAGENNIFFNSQMQPKQLREYCDLDQECAGLLKQAVEKLSLSARAYDRIIKVSRTIADLECQDTIKPGHIAEAIQYRSLDRII